MLRGHHSHCDSQERFITVVFEKCIFELSAAMAGPAAAAAMPLPPTLLADDFEVSVHSCGRTLVRELGATFTGVDVRAAVGVPTAQRAIMDLVNVGPDVAAEKDRLLERVGARGRLHRVVVCGVVRVRERAGRLRSCGGPWLRCSL